MATFRMASNRPFSGPCVGHMQVLFLTDEQLVVIDKNSLNDLLHQDGIYVEVQASSTAGLWGTVQYGMYRWNLQYYDLIVVADDAFDFVRYSDDFTSMWADPPFPSHVRIPMALLPKHHDGALKDSTMMNRTLRSIASEPLRSSNYERNAPVWSNVDPYGFERPDDFDYATYEEFMSDYMAILARRAIKWSTVVSGTIVNGGESPLPKSRKIKRYIRKGIPSEHRAEVWMYMSGAHDKLVANPGLYHRLLEQEPEPLLVETIEKDIPRTFPENIYFQNTPSDTMGKRKPMYNVLLACAHHNPKIGYCQGMNFIAGILLLVVKDEEKTFWLMDMIVSDMFPGYYTSDMIGSQVDQVVLGELVKLKVPRVAAVFEREGVEWSLVSAKWFICLMGDVLPVETVLRIWDCLFYEGSKILFRVVLTLIKRNEQRLVACKNFPEIVSTCKSLTSDPMVVHCHEFMQSIFKEPGSFPRSLIQKLQAEAHARIT